MAGVFVSYAREDESKARKIACALEEASFDVWFDQRLHSGSEYSREIEQALKDAAAVVVLWSRHSIESAWVRDEAAEGRDSGRLVPVLIDQVRPPIGFRQFQTTDLSSWSGRGKPKHLQSVLSAVAEKAGISHEAAVRPTPAAVTRWKRLVPVAVAAIALLLIGGAALFFMRSTARPELAPTVAVLPFTADASDADARKLANAARDAVAHTLSTGAFSVSAVDAPPKDDRAPADYVISGQVTGTPDHVVATLRMKETAHDVVVFSHQFDAPRQHAWDLPEQIGAQVASQLSWTAPLIAMDRRHPSDPAVLKALLQGSTAGTGGNVGALQDYETARRVAAQAPNSPLALNQLAFNTAFALGDIPRDQRVQAVAAARRAADRTIAIAPEYGSGHVPWCLLHSEVRKDECEDRLRAAMRADPDDPFTNFFLASLVLNPLGRNKEAADLASLSLAHDQYMPYKIGLALRTFEATGRKLEAADLYRQAIRWWPDNQVIPWFRESGMIQRGDFEAAARFEVELVSKVKPSAALAAMNSKSLPAIRKACSGAEDFDRVICMLALAQIGDLDSAFTLADQLYPRRRGRTLAEEERIWLEDPGPISTAYLTGPGAAPLRGDKRYLALADRLGLLGYWRSGRLPDFCMQPRPEPICSQLHRR